MELENAKTVEDTKISPSKYFWIFIIGSVFGAYYEEILHIVRYFRRYGVFDYSPRRGVFWGPLSPVYGLGALMMSMVLVRKNDKASATFLKSALLGGLVEYIISFLQEFFLGTTSWNYDNKILSIGGRTTIPYMMFWGLLGILFIKFIYPLLSKIIDEIPREIYKKLTVIFVIFVSIDIFVSWTALGRQTLRHMGFEPITQVGELYDKYFDDEYIKEKFPNMVRSE